MNPSTGSSAPRVAILLLCLALSGCAATNATTEPAASSPPPAGAAPSTTPSTTLSTTPSTATSTPAPAPRPSPSGRTTRSQPPPVSPRPADGTVVMAADSPFGSILFDASGQAIYLFDAEEDGRPECYDDCARAWPPVLTDAAPQPGRGVRADLLGTTRRRDGTTQVTYAGQPLYFYADEGTYEVLCHDIEGFGGTWLAVQPDGTPAPT